MSEGVGMNESSDSWRVEELEVECCREGDEENSI
jgi:hypothetical protein